jgi:hypothetical protein
MIRSAYDSHASSTHIALLYKFEFLMILYLVNVMKTQLSWPMQMLLDHNKCHSTTVRPPLVVDLTECYIGVGGRLQQFCDLV